MSKEKTIRVYDYVDFPYEAVRRALCADALEVFRRATSVAALRAEAVASELHVNFAGIEIGADIAIDVKSIAELPKTQSSLTATIIDLEWKAMDLPELFPPMRAELAVYPLTDAETQLDLSVHYAPPLGALGGVIDAILMHRIAEAAVHHFVKDIAVYLGAELAKPA